MITDFILPDIGEGIVECELLAWLVAEGELIEEDQPVAEVMTDKATVQIPAMYSGVVKQLFYKPGDIAKVHAPLFSMELSGAMTTTQEKSAHNNDSQPVVSTAEKQDNDTNNALSVEDFLLPDIGEGIVECEIVKWHVEEGEQIEEDAVVVEVMTDKAVVEIPAKHAGVVVKRYYQQGEVAAVHKPLFSIAASDSSIADHVTQDKKSDGQSCDIACDKQVQNSSQLSHGGSEGQFEPVYIRPGKTMASPAVRRMAREQGVVLSDIVGTGKKGRVLKADVAAAIELRVGSDTHDEVKTAHLPKKPISQKNTGVVRTVKVKGIQAAMARQMVASAKTIPHFTVSDELQMDALMSLRKKLKPAFEKRDVKLSFMPFFIKSLSLALTEFPIVNAQLSDDGTALQYFSDHNIGFAVDSKMGLLVPNIKRVQDLSLLDIAIELQTLIGLAREGKLPGESLKGGTISISNIGVLGGITATPVINMPEAAIVALGKTQKLPRFSTDGSVIAQHIMHVNWSADHRFIDGATMVRFNNRWMEYLHEPDKMLMFLK